MTNWAEIEQARAKAHAKHGENSIEGILPSSPRWLPILVEEIGEVSHELTYDSTGSLRAELIDVLAVASAWLDALDGKQREAEVRRNHWGHKVCKGCGEEAVYCLCKTVSGDSENG